MSARTGKCPERVWPDNGYTSHVCGRPIKRDGLCGIHATAKDKRKAGEEERAARREQDRMLAVDIVHGTGMSVYIDRRPHGRYVEVRVPDFLAFLERQGIPVDTEGGASGSSG